MVFSTLDIINFLYSLKVPSNRRSRHLESTHIFPWLVFFALLLETPGTLLITLLTKVSSCDTAITVPSYEDRASHKARTVSLKKLMSNYEQTIPRQLSIATVYIDIMMSYTCLNGSWVRPR